MREKHWTDNMDGSAKKYEILKDDFVDKGSCIVYRIRALRDGKGVRMGELGGYIEKEENLSQMFDYAWVFEDAHVSGKAVVRGNAQVSGESRIYGNVVIAGSARLDNCTVYGDLVISGSATIRSAEIFGGEPK